MGYVLANLESKKVCVALSVVFFSGNSRSTRSSLCPYCCRGRDRIGFVTNWPNENVSIAVCCPVRAAIHSIPAFDNNFIPLKYQLRPSNLICVADISTSDPAWAAACATREPVADESGAVWRNRVLLLSFCSSAIRNGSYASGSPAFEMAIWVRF